MERSFFFLIIAISAFAQPRLPTRATIDICSVSVFIGMTKAAAIDGISKTCDMKRVDVAGPDTWVVTEKGPELIGVGTIAFKDSKVAVVKRTWLPSTVEGQTMRGLIRAITVAVKNRIGSGAVAGTLQAVVSHHPDSDYYQLRIDLPNDRGFTIFVMEHPETHKVQVIDFQELLDR